MKFKTSVNMRYQENSLRIFPNFPIRKTFDTNNIMCMRVYVWDFIKQLKSRLKTPQ